MNAIGECVGFFSILFIFRLRLRKAINKIQTKCIFSITMCLSALSAAKQEREMVRDGKFHININE